MNDEMQSYFHIILEALNCVEQPYYNLKTTYEPTGIVRERVFCYELYHHIRCLQTHRHETKLTLNGEIDKRGHLHFDKNDRKNPDFVFHIPGEMTGNTFVMEVKGTAKETYIDKCMKDFETLELFVSRYQYKAGIFLLYNYSFAGFTTALQEKLQEKFHMLKREISENIMIVCKENARVKPEVHTLEEVIHTK